MSNVIELRNKRKKNNKKYNPIGKYLLIICFILVALLIIALRIFKINHYEIQGNRLYSNEKILEILKIDGSTNIVNIYINSNKNLNNYPFIEDIKIEYMAYNKVKITVIEKQVIGYIFYMSNYLCIDKDGYIIDYVQPENLDEKIPIIEGLSTDSLVLGEKINISKNLIDICYLFYKSEIEYDLNIDKITFNESNSENILINIKNIKVEFGNIDNFNQKIQIMKDILVSVPENENGTLYLGNNGKTSYYKKNLE